MKKLMIVLFCLHAICIFAKPKYPDFNSITLYNQKMNCTKHGRMTPCKCTLCGIDGHVMTKTGCYICIKEQHEKNIRILEEKRSKREAQKSLHTSSQYEGTKSNTDYNQNLRIERGQYEYEKSFIRDMSLTNGSIVIFSKQEVISLLGLEEWPFVIVQCLADGKYLARSDFKYINNSLYCLEFEGSDFVDDDKVKVLGYVSKAKYDYTTVNGSNKRVRVFISGIKAFTYLCPMLSDNSLSTCKVSLKENFSSSKQVEVTLVRNKSDFARTLPSVDLWVDTLKTFKYFGYRNGSLIQLKEEP